MSSRPNFACASATAAKSASRSLTSRAIGRIASPYFCTRSSRELMSRAVAATRSPRSRAAIAHSRPKPRDVPVMNQVFVTTGTLRRDPSPAQSRADAEQHGDLAVDGLLLRQAAVGTGFGEALDDEPGVHERVHVGRQRA